MGVPGAEPPDAGEVFKNSKFRKMQSLLNLLWYFLIFAEILKELSKELEACFFQVHKSMHVLAFVSIIYVETLTGRNAFSRENRG